MAKKGTFEWNEKRLKELEKYWCEDMLTTLEIAKIFGVSKNAIVGKIFRLNLKKGSKDKEGKNTGKKPNAPKNQAKAKQTLEKVASKQEVTPENNKIVKRPTKMEEKPEYGKYLFNQLTQNKCFWPYGEDDFTFCGKPVAGYKLQYCMEHFKEAYATTTKKKRQ